MLWERMVGKVDEGRFGARCGFKLVVVDFFLFSRPAGRRRANLDWLWNKEYGEFVSNPW